jgi:ubiquinone biosynthesis protein UbiJ
MVKLYLLVLGINVNIVRSKDFSPYLQRLRTKVLTTNLKSLLFDSIALRSFYLLFELICHG